MRIHMLASTVTTLGPFKRYGIWVQGCERNCIGCIATKSWDKKGGKEFSLDELYNLILLNTDIEGITISGGEPFLQAKELYELIKKLKIFKDYGVIVYTGYTHKELMELDNLSINRFLSQIDILIDGAYIKDFDDGLSLRGSSNQRVICLTDRYKDIINEYYGCNGRHVEFRVDIEKIQAIGIPDEKTKKVMRKYIGNG